LQKIIIPRTTLVLLIGPAGSGKSTFAARHFRPTEIISSDECRSLISDDPANQQVTPMAFRLMHEIIAMRLACGKLTVADATNLKAEDRRPLFRIARRFRFHLAALVFNIPSELCQMRNAERSRIVPTDAILLQYDLLHKALGQIRSEPFNIARILDEADLADIVIQIGRSRASR
jgi:protein phosphatase